MTRNGKLAVIRPLVSCILLAGLFLTGSAQGSIIHDTQGDFAAGLFDQTVLAGSEMAPEIRLGAYPDWTWTFQDEDISGWSFNTLGAGSIALEDPPGQIHLRAEPSNGESYALASRTDVAIPVTCTVEFRVYLDAIGASDIGGDLGQPRGACARLDVQRAGGGFRLDIFTDKMVSIYREGTTGHDYPTLTEVDIATETGRWYTYRFECDFNTMQVDVYRDGDWVDTFLADSRNAAAQTLRMLAYSRVETSGLAELHIDSIRLGAQTEVLHQTGTYTSEVLHVGAAALGALSWTEVPASPYPWGPWVKNPDNPILQAPALNENILCDIDDPLQQPLLYDGYYWMVYATGGTGGTIRLAYTADPDLMSWTPYAGNPILEPGDGPDGPENYVFSPHLFKDGATYYLFYDVGMAADGRQRNAYATASSPLGPWTKGQIILDRGTPGEWDDFRVTEPFVWKEGDTYFLYYMGDTGCSGCNEQIGLATTPASLFPLGPEPGGLWTKHGLVLPYDPDPTGWDRGLTADPSIIKVGDVFFMRYTGSYANEHWELGTAWATDPYGPWQRPPEPDIRRGPPGSWDDDRLVRGAIHFHEGRYYSPYTGNDGGPYRGGIASADPAALDEDLLFATRTSPDGITWEEWLPVANGGQIQSSAGAYLQYQATFNASTDGLSPALTSVAIELETHADLGVTPLASGPINCSQTALLTYRFTPAAVTLPVRGYEVRLIAGSELSIGAADVTFFTVPAGAQVQAYVVENADNDLTLNYAIVGETEGIVDAADLFAVEVHGAGTGEGTVQIESIVFRGLENEDIDVAAGPPATIVYDCTPPAAVADLAAVPGHEQVTVSWVHDGQDTDQFLVYRGLWHTDDPVVSAYPLYDDHEFSTIPVRPASPAEASTLPGWTLAGAVAADAGTLIDDGMTSGRGVYYYEVFAVDAVANVSDAAAASARATNYWLGDVSSFAEPGTADGLVSIADLHRLGETFGLCTAYDLECDVGPTDDWSRLGIPLTDGCIDFEDLMIFAMNFGVVDPGKRLPAAPTVHLAWVRLAEEHYALRLTGGDGLQGLRVRASLPAGAIAAVSAGELLAAQDGPTFLRNIGEALDVSLAVMGADQGFAGAGDLFIVVTAAEITGSDLTIEARGPDNSSLTVSFEQVTGVEIPRAFSLSANFPNPFNPMTTIRFALPEPQPVQLAIYGVDGRRVALLASARYAAGVHELIWNGQDDAGQPVATGTYFYRIDAGPYQQVRKMVLVK